MTARPHASRDFAQQLRQLLVLVDGFDMYAVEISESSRKPVKSFTQGSIDLAWSLEDCGVGRWGSTGLQSAHRKDMEQIWIREVEAQEKEMLGCVVRLELLQKESVYPGMHVVVGAR